MGFKVAIFSLNQWALDFEGNTDRIIQSIDSAAKVNAAYRAGPELELSGYSLEDAFFEQDTLYHCWTGLVTIVKHSKSVHMIIDIGLPIYNSTLYNCRAIIYRGKILCIRAKTSLALEGIYREPRHFTPWDINLGLTAFKLPEHVSREIDQKFVPFGANFILDLGYIKIGWEICQELWDPIKVSPSLYQNFGCHLVLNGSASYWELRKLNTVMDMVKGVSLTGGACYGFSNSVGCDGQRYVFYGRSCIYDRGQLVAMTPTSNDIFQEIQMIEYTINPKDIDNYRAQMAIKLTRSKQEVKLDLMNPASFTSQIDSSCNVLWLEAELHKNSFDISNTIPNTDIRFEQEIHQYVSLWLWDYLRRSKMVGFMMPLSGGLDSSTVATLVYSMCNFIDQNRSDPKVAKYFEDVHKISMQQIDNPKKICHLLLKCSYLSTKYSGPDTLKRAKLLTESIGANFSELSIQKVYDSFRQVLNPEAKDDVSLLDQNLQARLRKDATYYLSGGNRIVLATGNVDEAIMGYLTKYDCSSADINPIGGLCKDDLKGYLRYCCSVVFKDDVKLVEVLKSIIEAPPSAELTGAEQRDEDEIGITYDEISILGRVRLGIYGCNGPFGAFEVVWRKRLTKPFCEKIRCLRNQDENQINVAMALGDLVKRFYDRYAKNRHKLTVLTPALHAETYSPDDNRFDHRHFLYAPWTNQFKCIDDFIDSLAKTK